ncbi:MAG: coproporphyrinogen dehydrogenase HemZ, partial [Lachnospiraceae bacterium]|nr:coproporphyrinogen dehydrogenase HemZ [Lachnospiraceae bacterium]
MAPQPPSVTKRRIIHSVCRKYLFVKLSQPSYEYDVNSIIKAFYPDRQVKVLTEESVSLWQEYQEVMASEEEKNAAREILIELGATGGRMTMNVEGKAQECMGRVYEWETVAESAAENPEQYKAGFKTFLYKTLEEHVGRSLPWGNLTGIRPTKIAFGLLEEGKSPEFIENYLREKYFVSQEKALLGIDVAQRERDLLSQIHYQDGYSLYVGIPFCPTTCLYCSFTSFPIAAYRKKVDAYLDCLLKEMEYVSKAYHDKVLDTIYVGGGTPTTLEPEQLEKLLGGLHHYFDFSQVKEFTVEAGRADSITRDKLKTLKKHGVTRISVNPQTMKQETLDLIGRKASVSQVLEAYQVAREEGFDNINMDLILGLPGEGAGDVQNTIDAVVELAPDSLTVHSLAVKRASKLGAWIEEHGMETMTNTDETMKIAARGAQMLGMNPYYLYRQKNMSGNFENVGYAKPGKYGLYNILIMEEVQTILALGA